MPMTGSMSLGYLWRKGDWCWFPLLLVATLCASCRDTTVDQEFGKAFESIREGDSKAHVLEVLAPWEFAGSSAVTDPKVACGSAAVERLVFRSSEYGLTGMVSVDKEGVVRCVVLLSPMRKYG